MVGRLAGFIHAFLKWMKWCWTWTHEHSCVCAHVWSFSNRTHQSLKSCCQSGLLGKHHNTTQYCCFAHVIELKVKTLLVCISPSKTCFSFNQQFRILQSAIQTWCKCVLGRVLASPLYVCDFSTGYNLFCKEQVNHITGVSKKMYCIVLAKRWKELTENQRKEYSVRCREVWRWTLIWDDCRIYQLHKYSFFQLKRQYQKDLNCCLMVRWLQKYQCGIHLNQ